KNGLAVPVFVPILKEVLPRYVLTLLDDSRQTFIMQIDGVFFPALTCKFETQFLAVDIDMLVAQGGQPERVVRLHIFGIADAYEGCLEQFGDPCTQLCPGKCWQGQVTCDSFSDHR